MVFAYLAVVAVATFIIGLRVRSVPRGCLIIALVPLVTVVVVLIVINVGPGDAQDGIAVLTGPVVATFVASISALLGRAWRFITKGGS